MKRAGGLIFLKIAESLKYLSNDRKVARMEENRNIITRKVKIAELQDFKGHPFKVEYDMKLFELSKSIEENGVLVPLIVRKNPYGVGYKIISGHRRKMRNICLRKMIRILKQEKRKMSFVAELRYSW